MRYLVLSCLLVVIFLTVKGKEQEKFSSCQSMELNEEKEEKAPIRLLSVPNPKIVREETKSGVRYRITDIWNLDLVAGMNGRVKVLNDTQIELTCAENTGTYYKYVYTRVRGERAFPALRHEQLVGHGSLLDQVFDVGEGKGEVLIEYSASWGR